MADAKLRLNVLGLLRGKPIGKVLLLADPRDTIDELQEKIRGQLAAQHEEARLQGPAAAVHRLVNSDGAHFAGSQVVGDVLSDAEMVVALCVADKVDRSAERLDAERARKKKLRAKAKHKAMAEAMADAHQVAFYEISEDDDDDVGGGAGETIVQGGGVGEEDPDTLAPAPTAAMYGTTGPQETLECDLPGAPAGEGAGITICPDPDTGGVEVTRGEAAGMGGAAVRDPSAGLSRPQAPPGKLNSDWSVDALTPKLREYVAVRFQQENGPVEDSGADAGGISVFLKPSSTTVGAPAVHYRIARVDVLEFERLCKRNVRELGMRVEYLERALHSLRSLINKGTNPDVYGPSMMPYTVRPFERQRQLLDEAHRPIFGGVEGMRPVLVIDLCSHAVRGNLVYFKAALQKALYSIFATKSAFNITIALPLPASSGADGSARPALVSFGRGMMPPCAQTLREAEDFLDAMADGEPFASRFTGAGGANWRQTTLFSALSQALTEPNCDAVYCVTSGFPARQKADYIAAALDTINSRGVPIHFVGVDCDAFSENLLSQVALRSGGDFRAKALQADVLDRNEAVTRDALAGGGAVDASDAADTRLTIGGQVQICQIMLEEQRGLRGEWAAELQCAARLLLATMTQGAIPTVADERAGAAGLSSLECGYALGNDQFQSLADLFGLGRTPAEGMEDPSAAQPIPYLGDSMDRSRVLSENRQRYTEFKPLPGGQARSSGVADMQLLTTRMSAGHSGGFGKSSRATMGQSVSAAGSRPSLANPWETLPNAAVKVSDLARRLKRQAEALN